MDVKEKLVELLREFFAKEKVVSFGEMADHFIAHGVTMQEWISVEDRLPELEQIVLAVLNEPNKRLNYPYEEKTLFLFRKGYNYITGYEEKWERPFGAETVDYNDEVTHWMPLPQPPEFDK